MNFLRIQKLWWIVFIVCECFFFCKLYIYSQFSHSTSSQITVWNRHKCHEYVLILSKEKIDWTINGGKIISNCHRKGLCSYRMRWPYLPNSPSFFSTFLIRSTYTLEGSVKSIYLFWRPCPLHCSSMLRGGFKGRPPPKLLGRAIFSNIMPIEPKNTFKIHKYYLKRWLLYFLKIWPCS